MGEKLIKTLHLLIGLILVTSLFVVTTFILNINAGVPFMDSLRALMMEHSGNMVSTAFIAILIYLLSGFYGFKMIDKYLK